MGEIRYGVHKGLPNQYESAGCSIRVKTSGNFEITEAEIAFIEAESRYPQKITEV